MDDTTPFRPVLVTQTQLEAAWRHLIGPYGYSGRSLWLMMIGDDDRPFPHLSEFAEMAEAPGPAFVEALAEVLAGVVDDVRPARLAFLVSRPGRDGAGPADRAWARAAQDVATALGVRCDVVHLATELGVVPLPLDDLGVRSA